MKVQIFGQLTDITHVDVVEMEHSVDTTTLLEKLHAKYPRLAGATYRIAVNNKLVNINTLLTNESIVAVLPPFSGG